MILFYISQPGAVLLVPRYFFFYHHCYYFHRERGLFSTQRSKAVGALFLPFRDVALLLCDEGHGSPSEAVAGDGCHSEGPGLMSTFYTQGGEPQADCHVVLHALPLSHRNPLAHSLVLHTGDAAVNKNKKSG